MNAPPSDNGPNTVSGAGPSIVQAAANNPPSAIVHSSGGGYDPPEHVNPFAATASPSNPVNHNPSSSSQVAAAVSVKHHDQGDVSAIAATALPSGVIPSRGDGGAALIGVPPAATSESNPPRSQSQPPASGNSQVSPLAVSNAISQRNAFKDAMEHSKDRGSVPPPAGVSTPNPAAAAAAAPASTPAAGPPPPAKKKAPGTQMMANAPLRPLPKPGDPRPGSTPDSKEAAPAPVAKKPARTVAMGFNQFVGGKLPGAAGAGPSSVAPGSALGGGPPAPQSALGQTPQQSQAQPPSGIVAPSHVQPQPQPQPPQPAMTPQQPMPPMPPSVMQPSQAYPPPQQPYQPPMQQQPPQGAYPSGPGGWGWSPTPGPAAAPQQQQQQPPPSAYNPYPFAYTPGSRVHVTWSNGQRYPATVNQVSGSQCLVMFPDGQQHWVEMQYLSPG